jgi:hypothetical protein
MRRTRGVLAALIAAAFVTLSTGAAWSVSVPGRVAASDATLRPGCHPYHYHYVVTPGTGDWVLETWLYDPRGKERGYGYFLTGGDPMDNHPSFTICRANVVPGRFTIKARLQWYDDPLLPILPPVEHDAALRPAHFRLSRP